MDFIFISMPYARFISKWFANVPDINLGIMQAFLAEKGKSVKTFHFHLEFLPYLRKFNPRITDNLLKLTEQFGVEYMGLDYVFASILFENKYLLSRERFRERPESLGLTLNDFEELRDAARSFIESSFLNDLAFTLDDFERKGLMLYSPDRTSFLSLATQNKNESQSLRDI